jgi:hypothetical protein
MKIFGGITITRNEEVRGRRELLVIVHDYRVHSEATRYRRGIIACTARKYKVCPGKFQRVEMQVSPDTGILKKIRFFELCYKEIAKPRLRG